MSTPSATHEARATAGVGVVVTRLALGSRQHTTRAKNVREVTLERLEVAVELPLGDVDEVLGELLVLRFDELLSNVLTETV